MGKQKLRYKVLAPSIMTPYPFFMDLWRLWAHLCVRSLLSVKVVSNPTYAEQEVIMAG